MPRSIALVLALVGLAPACGAPEPTAPPSLALIVIDTLRADAVSSYGGPRRSTPNLDRLAAKGLVYRHAYAPAPWTLPSHATLLTGVGPAEHGVGLHGRMALPDTLTTLAERRWRTSAPATVVLPPGISMPSRESVPGSSGARPKSPSSCS